jgi:hypothetical protein
VLQRANLRSADLLGANLREADLRGARGVTVQQLAQARLDDLTTMPDGQRYEDWLKDKEGNGKDVENE